MYECLYILTVAVFKESASNLFIVFAFWCIKNIIREILLIIANMYSSAHCIDKWTDFKLPILLHLQYFHSYLFSVEEILIAATFQRNYLEVYPVYLEPLKYIEKKMNDTKIEWHRRGYTIIYILVYVPCVYCLNMYLTLKSLAC